MMMFVFIGPGPYGYFCAPQGRLRSFLKNLIAAGANGFAVGCGMRIVLAPLLVVLIATPVFAGRELASLPVEMRGTWDISYQSCRVDGSDSRVTVESRDVTMGTTRYESDHIMPLSDGVRIDAITHEQGSQDGRGSLEMKLIDATRLSVKTDFVGDTYVNCKDATQ
jgi:hypothetical protein